MTEARAALTRAGQLFRSVAQSTGEGQPQGKFSSGAQRALVQWSRALCARAALADEPQVCAGEAPAHAWPIRLVSMLTEGEDQLLCGRGQRSVHLQLWPRVPHLCAMSGCCASATECRSSNVGQELGVMRLWPRPVLSVTSRLGGRQSYALSFGISFRSEGLIARAAFIPEPPACALTC